MVVNTTSARAAPTACRRRVRKGVISKYQYIEIRVYVTVLHSVTCMLVCWDFIDTLEIITRILREVVNRERLRDTIAFCLGGFRNFWGCQTHS